MGINAFASAVVALFFCLAAAPAPAADGTFSLGVGIDYTSGDYGTGTTTKITSIPVTGKYESGPWLLRVTVPYLYVSGGTAVIPGLGAPPNLNPTVRGGAPGGGGTTTTGSANGPGDVVAAMTYNLQYDSATRAGIDLTGKIKFGTADRDKGLGTGENDHSVQIDAFRGYGMYTFFGGVGYTFYGSSEFITLNDAFNAVAGGTYKIGDRDTAGLSLDVGDRVAPDTFPRRELTAYFTRRLDGNWKAQAYFLKGLADGSPDWGVGASISHAF